MHNVYSNVWIFVDFEHDRHSIFSLFRFLQERSEYEKTKHKILIVSKVTRHTFMYNINLFNSKGGELCLALNMLAGMIYSPLSLLVQINPLWPRWTN